MLTLQQHKEVDATNVLIVQTGNKGKEMTQLLGRFFSKYRITDPGIELDNSSRIRDSVIKSYVYT